MSVEPGVLQLTSPQATLTDGVVTWNVEQLQAAVADWRAQMDLLDVRIVAFDLPNGLEWVALSIALLDSGRTAVPLPSFFSSMQRQHAISDSNAQLLVTQFECLEKSNDEQTAFRGTLLSILRSGTVNQLPPGTALVTYTSGSTGNAKGICLSAQTLLATARSIVTALADVGVRRHLSVLPLTLLLENVAGLFANLINGSEIHVPNLTSIGIHGSSEVDIEAFVQGVEWHAPHSMILVPGLLLGLTAASEFGLGEFASLKFVAVGGGKISPSLLERAATQSLPVYEGYGLTECSSVVAMNTPEACRAGTVGRLLPHVQAQLVNGELVVSQPRLLGVLGEPPSAAGQVVTGDLIEIDEQGFLSVRGRRKNTYITAYGRNVSPEWIESELQSELVISYAAVFGEGQNQATALLVPRGDAADADLQAAVDACNARLPDYARVGMWHRLSLQALQQADGLTANGRIRRDAVAQGFAGFLPAPDFLPAPIAATQSLPPHPPTPKQSAQGESVDV